MVIKQRIKLSGWGVKKEVKRNRAGTCKEIKNATQRASLATQFLSFPLIETMGFWPVILGGSNSCTTTNIMFHYLAMLKLCMNMLD